MTAVTHDLDLTGLGLSAGEARRLALEVAIEPLILGGQRYRTRSARTPVKLEVSRMAGGGYALRMRFLTSLSGPCMRCLKAAEPSVEVDAREVDRPGGGEDLDSPYVDHEILDLAAWAHDAFALAAPVKVLCNDDCAGLCPVCAADLGEADADHDHPAAPDPRWARLRELKLG